ncbi:MAG TPA: hypothetical protein VJ720_13395, partial [Chitinophaga sp.]|nr:hypothetical protein [Chitinophaga sp.]
KTGFCQRFRELERRYHKYNVRFFWYPDTANLLNFGIQQADYAPLLRPHMLKKHFFKYPELRQKAVFYHDSDIIFTRRVDFEPFLADNTCYLSNARGYLGTGHFDDKAAFVKPGLKDEFIQEDILDRCAKIIGISRQVCEQNDQNAGGAQYILKNIDHHFWEDVEMGAYRLRRLLNYELGGINAHYFPSEKEGIQSWCADMWALLWNLWKRNIPTATPASLNFCWATDKIEKWDLAGIYHDAGINDSNHHYLFNKRAPVYTIEGRLPYEVSHEHVSREYCSYNYVQYINKIKNRYYPQHEESLCQIR